MLTSSVMHTALPGPSSTCLKLQASISFARPTPATESPFRGPTIRSGASVCCRLHLTATRACRWSSSILCWRSLMPTRPAASVIPTIRWGSLSLAHGWTVVHYGEHSPVPSRICSMHGNSAAIDKLTSRRLLSARPSSRPVFRRVPPTQLSRQLINSKTPLRHRRRGPREGRGQRARDGFGCSC